MQTTPISITMLTYNRAKYIREALDSVVSQSFQDWELIIIDDGSTDTTAEIVNSYKKDSRIRYIINDSNRGIVYSRNKALEMSRGTYIAVLDSDDVWSDKKKLELQIAFLEEHDEYTLVGSKDIEVIDADINAEDLLPSDWIRL